MGGKRSFYMRSVTFTPLLKSIMYVLFSVYFAYVRGHRLFTAELCISLSCALWFMKIISGWEL